MTKAVMAVVCLLALVGMVAAIGRTVTLASTLAGEPLPPAGSFDGGFARNPALTLLHILPGFFFMVLGPFQFVAKLRSRNLNVHRWCGRVYVACGLVTGVTALMLGVVVGFGGATETSAVVFFSTLFLVFLAKALRHILHREIDLHREWMIRAFALGLSISTMRPLVGLFFALTDLSFPEILGIVFWLAFSLHLVVAEVWVHHTRRYAA